MVLTSVDEVRGKSSRQGSDALVVSSLVLSVLLEGCNLNKKALIINILQMPIREILIN